MYFFAYKDRHPVKLLLHVLMMDFEVVIGWCPYLKSVSVFMVALCNRADHYIFMLWFVLSSFSSSSSSSFFFSSPNLSRRRLDVCHTSRGVTTAGDMGDASPCALSCPPYIKMATDSLSSEVTFDE